MDPVPTLEETIVLVAQAHQGQVDKAGEPYILHPIRVMLRVKELTTRQVALLHDVVEDTEVTLNDLRQFGYTDEVIEAVELLTHGPQDDYETYIEQIARNPIAREVKLADLADNLDVTRLSRITEATERRLARYRRAVARLETESQ